MRSKKMEKITVADFDPAEYIKTAEDVVNFLEAAIEENDADFLISAIGDIARSRGMSRLAGELNLDRAGLYKSFSPNGNPSFKTVFNLLDILGFKLKVERKSA
jgi:probable addiction module antidote protein